MVRRKGAPAHLGNSALNNCVEIGSEDSAGAACREQSSENSVTNGQSDLVFGKHRRNVLALALAVLTEYLLKIRGVLAGIAFVRKALRQQIRLNASTDS